MTDDTNTTGQRITNVDALSSSIAPATRTTRSTPHGRWRRSWPLILALALTVGTTEWAGLGLLLCYIVLPTSGVLAKMIVAIVLAFAGTLVLFAFLRRVTLKSSLIVPIVGIMFGAAISAFSTFLALQFNLLQVLGGWFMGSFTHIEIGRYEPLWSVLAVAIVVVVVADRFTVAGLGKDIATGVGLNYERIVLLGVGLVSLVTGVVTVVVGSLPFLGLIVPNLVSMVRGDDLRSTFRGCSSPASGSSPCAISSVAPSSCRSRFPSRSYSACSARRSSF